MSDLAALVAQQSLNGVYLGCLYVMVALGLTLISGVLNQIARASRGYPYAAQPSTLEATYRTIASYF